ncbi:hypothetical protein SLG_36020 [Sphingobium sp. SYK-6]|uniref:cupin domain-containing protein n=1 Tax=Sphingobium sp. (strain NBRC 103272 / SYK-6) TaxID=627192 RepID=UPI0002277C9F|nr:cupin domain-containing protein [Sphingobium sp. SYK-6]BAK68277.1 hypothetical protein SLG_36020 [Sphingobium sp. SYK-6]
MRDWLVTPGEAHAALPETGEAMRYADLMRHGTMSLGLYAPRGPDTQSPHSRDELYIIASGSGLFVKNGEQRAFGPQDAIFVEAGAEHRFVEMSDDFAAWVIFWGPEGGEAP